MELHGREVIYTSNDNINAKNVVAEVNNLLALHMKNYNEMRYLERYRKGYTPVLYRKKEIRPEICHKIVENHAEEIVSFKNGYFLTKPMFYKSRNAEKQDMVNTLNEFLYRSGKQNVDNDVVDSFHTVGKGVLYVEPTKEKESPFKVHFLNACNSFVVYSLNVGNEPVMGVNIVQISENKIILDVFTKNKYFQIGGGIGISPTDDEKLIATATSLIGEGKNAIGEVPIVEYFYNRTHMSSFEMVIPLIDAMCEAESNRLDGISQFVQSLMVLTNCEIENGVTGNDIRQAGLIQLQSNTERPADVKVIAEQLDQTQSQVFMDNLYSKMVSIVGMPNTANGSSGGDNMGAVFYRDGWEDADTYARNTADLFRKSNRYFDKVILAILRKRKLLDLDINDFELQFAENEMHNMLTRSQTALNLKQLGLSPEIVLIRSGVSNDAINDIRNSKKYMEKYWNDSVEPTDNTDDTENPEQDGLM